MTETAAAPTLPLVVSPDMLSEHLGDPRVVIVDLTLQQEPYCHVHIPGAVWLDFRRLLNGHPPTPAAAPPEGTIVSLLSGLGIDASAHVVAYDDEGGGWASRLLWTLALIGHRHYSLLDGGLHAWLAGGHSIASTAAHPAVRHYKPGAINRSVFTDAETLMASPERFTIWDARSPAEYRGEWGQARRKGHMPGAINLDWRHLFDPQRHYRLKPRATLQALLSSHALTPERTIVTHCQSHHRSSLAWLVGQHLGYPALSAYPGAWLEWGNRVDTPIIQ